MSLRNGARRESGTGHGKLPEEGEEEDASSAVASSPPGVSLSSVGGQSEFREEEPSEGKDTICYRVISSTWLSKNWRADLSSK